VLSGSAAQPPPGILTAVGATSLVELRNILPAASIRILAKLEGLNPGGSAKDRSAVGMILDAVRTGAVTPGESVVVESSSGNLAIGLAQVCRYLRLRFICVVDPKTTPQHLAILQAYMAEVETVTRADGETGEYLPARLERVRQIVAATPRAFWLNQYANLANARAQETTMHEIVSDAGGRVDYLFCATGSCGTLRGCADYVRKNGLPTKVVAVDAVGSAIFGQKPAPRLIPGHGSAVRPELCRPGLADEVVHVRDVDCIAGCRRLVRDEAILAGGSSGAVVTAVGYMQSRIPADSTCVLIFPDRGERYLNTIYCDGWVREHFGDVSHLWRDRAE
jgi:N-(2-amino-2-carboxyethyl)-L-glutamate synthase